MGTRNYKKENEPPSPKGDREVVRVNIGYEEPGPTLKDFMKDLLGDGGPILASSGSFKSNAKPTKDIEMACFYRIKLCLLGEEKVFHNHATFSQIDIPGSVINNENSIVNKSKTRAKEMVVKLNDTVLNTGKHSAVTFKVSNESNKGSSNNRETHNRSCETLYTVKGRGFGIKSDQIRSGKRLNQKIKYRGERFKVAGISK
ncbi:hypothetical protein Goarm_013066, partial [Gossypium armourianum]|nr:hypothetical protein [Gossypium armourianum]